jgi:hypothetical protein
VLDGIENVLEKVDKVSKKPNQYKRIPPLFYYLTT